MSSEIIPKLSIVIPIFNEEVTLPQLCQTLESQIDICCQVIFCDGGSQDNSLELLRDYAKVSCHQIQVLTGERGRGRQMNQGAEVANSSLLLFLHADSFWHQKTMLSDAVCHFHQLAHNAAGTAIAAHFTLQFNGQDSQKRFYRYLSEKSHLNRPGTIYGDQGFMLTKQLWHEIGGFSHDGTLLEDMLFAEEVAQHGQWLLLPQVIFTSNRRYRHEGRLSRIIRNGMMVIVAGAGFKHLLTSSAALSGGYCKDRGDTKPLSSFVLLLHRMSLTHYGRFWYGCGRLVTHQFWLVIYAASWMVPLLNSAQRQTILSFYDRRIAPLLLHCVSYTFWAVLSWFLFYFAYRCLPASWFVPSKTSSVNSTRSTYE